MKQVKGIDTKGYSLYEVTERDLAFLVDHAYHVGNILIFNSPANAKLGREIGRANNLKAAEEFLAQSGSVAIDQRGLAPGASRGKDSALSEVVERYEGLRSEDARHYEKRITGLIRENEELRESNTEKSQRIHELSFLSLQNDIQREELINDLKEASNMAAVKAVVELDELRVRIVELEAQLATEKNERVGLENATVLLSAEKSVLEHELLQAQALLDAYKDQGAFKTASDDETELILTNSSGSVIHIYHEFPPAPKQSISRKLFSHARRATFIIIGFLVVAYIFYLTSVLDTMRASGVDVQTYSDAVLDGIRKLFGL